MDNKNLDNKDEKKGNNLEWGDHNPRLTDENFIDRNRKKASSTDELLAPTTTKEEPGRNRKGVKEGESALDLNEKRGKVF